MNVRGIQYHNSHKINCSIRGKHLIVRLAQCFAKRTNHSSKGWNEKKLLIISAKRSFSSHKKAGKNRFHFTTQKRGLKRFFIHPSGYLICFKHSEQETCVFPAFVLMKFSFNSKAGAMRASKR